MTADREALRDRLHRYADGDSAAVCGIPALKEVGAVLGGLAAVESDVDLARLCGLLLWCRSQEAAEDADHDDLIPALALLLPVWRTDPSRVPPPIAEYFAEIGAGPITTADAWHGPALALAAHSRATGDADACRLAIGLLRRVVAATPPVDPGRGQALTNLAMALQDLGELTGDPEALDEAVAVGEQAIPAFGTGDPRGAVPMAATAVALRRRSALRGDRTDLDTAIALGREALRRTADSDAARPERWSNLGVALLYRFELSGDQADLDGALASHRSAVTATPPDDPRRSAHLTNLATALMDRFEETGAVASLGEAADAIAEAALAPALSHAVRAAVSSTQCTILRARFRYTANSTDLDHAVDAGERAVGLLPPGHPTRPGALTNLGLARHAQGRRRDAPEGLRRAVDELSEAVAATPLHDPDRAGRLSNLCDALLSAADADTGAAPGLLDEAVRQGRAAAAAGSGHRHRAYYLSNLGNALMARYAATGGLEDLTEAIAAHEAAVDAGTPQSANLAGCLANLAAARAARHRRDPDRTDWLDAAIADTRRAARTTAGSVEVRIRAAVRWGHWSATAGRWPDALAGYTMAVGLLGDVSPRELPRGDQEFELTRLGGVVTDAAACALQAGDPAAAVQLLERGRGIVLSHALTGTTVTAADWRQLARAGPIALVNVSRFRSDVLLLTGDDLVVLPLPHVDPDTVRAHAATFLNALASLGKRAAGDRSPDANVHGILAWLWDEIAEPVCDRLGLTGGPAPGRLWWCPTGLLSVLPLAAAGRHGIPGASLLDRTVSSVTPTLRALAEARRVRSERSAATVLLITADAWSLPAAVREERLLRSTFGMRLTEFGGGSDLATAMAAHSWLHVAGHAEADLTHPSRGGVVFGDRSRLTPGELGALRLPDAEMAYLSACETARTSPALADETVHLASALHVAGYRHVIATLWAVADRPALSVAEAVYRRLGGEASADAAPYALREAQLQLRSRHRDRPLTWAAYLHIGP